MGKGTAKKNKLNNILFIFLREFRMKENTFNSEIKFLRKRVEIAFAFSSVYKNGRYRIRTCDLTGVIRTL